jgi:hypothetical protein
MAESFELTAAPASARTMAPDEVAGADFVDARVHRRTLLKLDCLLLPFLAVLFLFNALDKANVSTTCTSARDFGGHVLITG